MKNDIKFNEETIKYKYFPMNMEKEKVLALKLSIDFTEIVEIDTKTGKERLYRLETMVTDWDPIAIYDYDNHFIVIGQTFQNELRICKYNKKEKKEVIYNWLGGKVKNLYSQKMGDKVYISTLEEIARLYTLNLEAEKLSLDICNESNEQFICYIKNIDESLILTHEISLKNKHKKSCIYDKEWKKIETISYNENSDDLCYAHDVQRNIKLVTSNVLGKKELYLQKDKQISKLNICNDIDQFEIEDYIYDRGVIIYRIEKALTCTLNSYNISTEEIKEIVSDEFIYNTKIIGNRMVLVGNSIESQFVVSIYDLEQNKIISKYGYPKQEFVNNIPEKKYIEVNGRRVDYMEYPADDDKNIRGYIVYLHGGPEAHWLPKYDEMFSQFQRNNFVIIYPNYFGSSLYGKIDYENEENKWGVKDLEEVLHIRKMINHKNVILMGESYGSYLAMKTWNENPNDWAGVIVYSTFYTPWSLYKNGSEAVKETVMRHISKKDIEVNEMKECSETKKVSTKMYLLHGKVDEKIPYEQSISIYEYLNRTYDWDVKPTIKLIDNIGHEVHSIYKSFKVNSYILNVIEEIS